MAFDASWRRLLIGGEDGSLRMWNFNNGQCLKEFLGFGQVCCNKGIWEKVYSLAYYWAERSWECVDFHEEQKKDLQKNLVPVLKMRPSSSPVWVTWTGTVIAPGSSSSFSLFFFSTLKIPVPVPNINGPGNLVPVPDLVPKRGSGFSLVFTNSG